MKHSPFHLLLPRSARAQVAPSPGALFIVFSNFCLSAIVVSGDALPRRSLGGGRLSWWGFPVSLGNSGTKMRLSQPFSFPFLTTSGEPPGHGRPPFPRTLSPTLRLFSQEEIPATSRWPQAPASWGLAAGDLPGCASSS